MNNQEATFVPKEVFFTKGTGRHKEKLRSFELALRDAGIQHQNIVLISSIFPPKCKIISAKKGLRKIIPGQVTYCVFATNATNEKSRLIAASVGLAVPEDKNAYGYLSEYHGSGADEETAGEYAEDLAASMLASSLGIEFNDKDAYDYKKNVFKLSGKIIKTTNITQSAVGIHNGTWTTVFAGAVFIS